MTSEELFEKCMAEEREYTFPEFHRSDVWDLGCDLVEAVKDLRGPVAVSIWMNGTDVFCYYPEGTGEFHKMWFTRKKNTVMTLQMSSLAWRARLEMTGSSLEAEGLDPAKYVANGGGFPLRIRGGCVIGFIGCSGLTDVEDHAAVLAGLDRFFKRKGWK